jgi:hypothetical protein
MASTYSTNLRLELITTGEQQGTWGSTTNKNLGSLLEQAVSGWQDITVDNTGVTETTLVMTDGELSTARNMIIELSGTITATRNVICPTNKKVYIVRNSTSGGFAVTFKVAGQTGVSVPFGQTVIIYVDGTDARQASLPVSRTNVTQISSIELGAASDTTITRSSAGVIAVEGVTVPLNSITSTHTALQYEIGNATDTTLTRVSAGVAAIEGKNIALNGTTEVLTTGSINLGNASDTTITRTGAGTIAVEGVDVALNSISFTHTALNYNVGNATDTTIARSAAGVISVEGGIVPKENRANTFTEDQTIDNNALIVSSTTPVGTPVRIVHTNDFNYPPYLDFQKYRTGGLAVANNDSLGGIAFQGYDGTNLQVAGWIMGEVDGTSGTSDMPGRIKFLTTPDGTASPAEAMRITNAQYLLVGYTTSNGAYRLQVNSQIFATSATIATSDGRYKENVTPVSGALNAVMRLNPVQFSWKDHPIHNFDRSQPTVGFIAQEVQEALADKPYLGSIVKANVCTIEEAKFDEKGVETSPAVTEEFLGIADGNMIPLLTKAIQELKAEFDAYKASHP